MASAAPPTSREEEMSGLLNPDMVYRPLTPPSGHYRDSDSGDNNEDEKPVVVRIYIVAILRLLLVVVPLTGIILWYISRLQDTNIIIFIALWLIFFRHGLLVVHNFCFRRGKLCLPTFSIQIGMYVCTLGHKGRDDDDGDGKEPPKKPPFWIFSVLDLFFAILLTIPLSMQRYYWHALEALVVSWVVMALQWAVAILGAFRFFRPLALYIYPHETEGPREKEGHGLRLPADVDARWARHVRAKTGPVVV